MGSGLCADTDRPGLSRINFSSLDEFRAFAEKLDQGEIRQDEGRLYVANLRVPFACVGPDGIELTRAGQIFLARTLHDRSTEAYEKLSGPDTPNDGSDSWRQRYFKSQERCAIEALGEITSTGSTSDQGRVALRRQVEIELACTKVLERLRLPSM